MELQDIINSTRAAFDGFNSPAIQDNLADLRRLFRFLPTEITSLYQDHDGADQLPCGFDGCRLVARLMPINEVKATYADMSAFDGGLPKVGEVVWLWTDDNSNYCGIYTDGLLRGWLCILNHEEPMLTPAFRSTTSFMARLLASSSTGNGEEEACDIPSLIRDVPVPTPDPVNFDKDLELASQFRKKYNDERDDDLRRLYAMCAICLTPFESTDDVMTFFQDPDMWTPEAAVRLLEVRRWQHGVEQFEKLAREGTPNGDGAAMRLLVRINNNDSRQAIARLRQALEGQKLKYLEMWADRRLRLQPPRW